MPARPRRAGAGGAREADDGSAVVDFVLLAVPLLFLLFAVLQVAVYFYARNVVAAAVSDAARYAAAEGVDPGAGSARAHSLLDAGLDSADAAAIGCTSAVGPDRASGLPVATIRCAGRLRLFFTPLGLPLTVESTASVLREVAPR